MAHYAFLDRNNVVIQVIVGKDEGEDGVNWEDKYGAMHKKVCRRTSYNTKGGIHYDQITHQPSTDQTKAFRKNYAGVGYTFDPERDAFIPPKIYESWTLNETSCLWEAPTPYPDDGNVYRWNEVSKTWDQIV